MNTIKRTLIALLFVFLFVEAENDSSLNKKKHLSLKGTKVRTWLTHSETSDTLDKTRLDDGHHLPNIQLKIEAVDGPSWTISLQLNHQLLTKEFFTKHQKNGKHVIHKPQTHEVDLCQYQGSVLHGPHSSLPSTTWAAISTCDNRIRGVFFDGQNTYHLHDSEWLYDEQQELTLNEQPRRCGHVSKNEKHYGFMSQQKRMKREVSESTIRGPYNANVHSRYVELVLVVDNKVYKDLDESLDRVYQHCKDIGNIINKLYQPLNIFVALVGVVVWSESDEIALSSNGDSTLSNFLSYRREKLVRDHPNDNAQLLTGVQFQDGVVGKALKGPMCTFEFSGGVNMDHSTVVGLVAATVAHEMGHNFGMEHDTAECNCTRERCIMAPSSSPIGPTSWSQCSLNYLALAFEHGMDYCLRNRPTRLFDGPVCGNGFVEPGEQCDCGLLERCDNPCCEPKTCMLRRNASCATGECCDLNLCRPKSPGTLCRPADAHECDLPEYCTGQSEYCPKDVYKLDGTACQQSKAYCFRGQCRTHSDQCRLLWGYSGHSSEQQCYAMNIKGTRHGNCGYNLVNKSYVKCQEQDTACGMLHCKHINEKLEFGMESVAILSHSFINSKGSIIPCRSALVDLGLNQADPGLAPDGAKCGQGKMCVNQKCMAVESLRQGISCPNNCNDNGVCNSLGHCHCNKGFAPPLCDYPGTGGSIDSGPAPDPQESSQLIWVYICITLVLFLIGTALYINCQRHYFCFERTKHFHPCFNLNNSKSSIPPPSVTGPTPPPSSGDAHGSSKFKSPSTILPGPGNTLINPTSESNHLIGDYRKFIINPITTKIPANSNSSLSSTTKPLISSPVLAATTCTAPEVAGAAVPSRPAPVVPPAAVSSAEKTEPEVNFKSSPLSSLSAAEAREYPELIRLASLQRRQEITRKPTRTSLRDLDISAPIPQGEISIAQNALPVSRAQSLRTSTNPPRQGIQSFGSMRQAPKRPSSIPPPPPPPTGKPTNDAPPPLPPPLPSLPLHSGIPLEQDEYCYDDCSSGPRQPETPIYAVIEESTPTPTPTPSTNHSSGSAESVGLLSEIVNEIHNRNIESIYNSSSLGRKGNKNSSEYVGGSESSSSGYLNPTKLETPNKHPTSESPNLSTNSSFSSSSTSSADNQTPLLPPANPINPSSKPKPSDISKPIVNPSTKPKPSSFNAKSSNTNKPHLSGKSITASDISKPINLINSTKTLTNAENIKPTNSSSPSSIPTSISSKPSLKSNKPSTLTSKPSTASKPANKSLTSKATTNASKLEPSRKAPLVPNTSTPPWRQQQEQQQQKRNSNSPDVVSSCSPNSNNKSVLSSSRPPDVIGARGPLASSVANRSNTSTKPSTINTVASLQQRFEAASRAEDKTTPQIRTVIAPPIKPRPANSSASKSNTQTNK